MSGMESKEVMMGNASEHRLIGVDTNIFRKHIGASWEFPEALGAMAHRGEITIHVPQIVDREFLSSIPEHVSEMLNKEAGARVLTRNGSGFKQPRAARDLACGN